MGPRLPAGLSIAARPARRSWWRAAARGLEPEQRDELGEELQWTTEFRLVRSLAGQDVVVVTELGSPANESHLLG